MTRTIQRIIKNKIISLTNTNNLYVMIKYYCIVDGVTIFIILSVKCHACHQLGKQVYLIILLILNLKPLYKILSRLYKN